MKLYQYPHLCGSMDDYGMTLWQDSDIQTNIKNDKTYKYNSKIYAIY